MDPGEPNCHFGIALARSTLPGVEADRPQPSGLGEGSRLRSCGPLMGTDVHADYTTKDSPWSVTDTVERLTAKMTDHHLTNFATIDQSAAARSVGQELRETVLILFGNPAAGTPVMDAEPLAALDLPLKVLVWDDGGRTRVSYLSPTALAARYSLSESLAAPLAGIDQLTELA
jgi:uncharacterized protein (DUF302 family)